MRDGAELRIATEVCLIAREWIAERMETHEAFERLGSVPRPGDWPPTKYELKAKEGRAADLFWYRRQPSALAAPKSWAACKVLFPGYISAKQESIDLVR